METPSPARTPRQKLFANPADCGNFAAELLAQADRLPHAEGSKRHAIVQRIRAALADISEPLVIVPLGQGGQQKSTTFNLLATGPKAEIQPSIKDPFGRLDPFDANFHSGGIVWPRFGCFPLPTGAQTFHVTEHQFRLRGAPEFCVSLVYEESEEKVGELRARMEENARETVSDEPLEKTDFARFRRVECGTSVKEMADTINKILVEIKRKPLAVREIVLEGPWRFYSPDPAAQKWELVDLPGHQGAGKNWQHILKKEVWDVTLRKAHIAAVFSNRVPNNSFFDALAKESDLWTQDANSKQRLRVFVHFSQTPGDNFSGEALNKVLDETSAAFRRMLMAQHNQHELGGGAGGSVPWPELAEFCTSFPRPWLTTTTGRQVLFDDIQKRALDVYARDLHSLVAALIFNIRENGGDSKKRLSRLYLKPVETARDMRKEELQETDQMFRELLPDRLEKYISALKGSDKQPGRSIKEVTPYLEMMIGLSFNLYSDSLVESCDKFVRVACRPFDELSRKEDSSVSSAASTAEHDVDSEVETEDSTETAYYAVCAGSGDDGWASVKKTFPEQQREELKSSQFAQELLEGIDTSSESSYVGDLAVELAEKVVERFTKSSTELQKQVEELLERHLVKSDTDSTINGEDDVIEYFRSQALPLAKKQMDVFRSSHTWNMDDPVTLSDYCHTINLAKSLRKQDLKKRPDRTKNRALIVNFIEDEKPEDEKWNPDTSAFEHVPVIQLKFGAATKPKELQVSMSTSLRNQLIEYSNIGQHTVAPIFMPSSVWRARDIADLNIDLSDNYSRIHPEHPMLDGRRHVLFLVVEEKQRPWYEEYLIRKERERVTGLVLVSVSVSHSSCNAGSLLSASKGLAEYLNYERMWLVGHLLKDFKQWNALAVRSEDCTAARVMILIQNVLDRVKRAPFEALKLRFDEPDVGFKALLTQIFGTQDMVGFIEDDELACELKQHFISLSESKFDEDSWTVLFKLVSALQDHVCALPESNGRDTKLKTNLQNKLNSLMNGEISDDNAVSSSQPLTRSLVAQVRPGLMHFKNMIEHAHIAGCVTPLPRFQSYAQLERGMYGGFSTVFSYSGDKSDCKGSFNGMALINVKETKGFYFSANAVDEDCTQSTFYRKFNDSIGNALAKFWTVALGRFDQGSETTYFSKVRLAAWACASRLELPTRHQGKCKVCKKRIELSDPVVALHARTGNEKTRAHRQCYLKQPGDRNMQALEAVELVLRISHAPIPVSDIELLAKKYWNRKGSLVDTIRKSPAVIKVDDQDLAHHKDFATFEGIAASTLRDRKRKAKVEDIESLPAAAACMAEGGAEDVALEPAPKRARDE